MNLRTDQNVHMDLAVENKDDGDEASKEEKEGMKLKEIIVITFIMGLWFYSLYRYIYIIRVCKVYIVKIVTP